MATSHERTPETDAGRFHPGSPGQSSSTTLGSPKAETDEAGVDALYEAPWDKQCVLSLDGGGIRGYSSLIILRELMKEIAKLEMDALHDTESPAFRRHSSFHPEEYSPCVGHQPEKTEVEYILDADHEDWHRYLPCHYFDYIGGTSTGGLISIMLGRLRLSVHACIEEYNKLSKDIFGSPRLASVRGPLPWLRDKYDGKTIQQAVEDVIKRRMSKAERQVGAGNFNSPHGLCKTAVFAYASKIREDVTEFRSGQTEIKTSDQEVSAPYIFRSYDHYGSEPPTPTERNPGVAHSIPIWEVARATTAAPTYFDPIRISNRKFGDGGFGTNNPAQEMFMEVAQMNGGDPTCISLLLSIGTGEGKPIPRLKDGTFAKYVGYWKAAKMLASDSKHVHENMETLQKLFHLPYYRFDVPLKYKLGRIKLDEFKSDTFRKIEDVTMKYCNEDRVRAQLVKVAEILVRQRRLRAESELWPLVSKGKQYRCTVDRCRRCQQLRPRKKELEGHLRAKHKLSGEDLLKQLEQGVVPRGDGR